MKKLRVNSELVDVASSVVEFFEFYFFTQIKTLCCYNVEWGFREYMSKGILRKIKVNVAYKSKTLSARILICPSILPSSNVTGNEINRALLIMPEVEEGNGINSVEFINEIYHFARLHSGHY